MDSFLKDRPKEEIERTSQGLASHALPPLGGALPTAQASKGPSGPAHIELVKDAQGRIAHIIVNCSCGQCMQLDCSYN